MTDANKPKGDDASSVPAQISPEITALAHYRKLSGNNAAIEAVLERLEDTILAELDGDGGDVDRVLAEQSLLLDAAFRFYLSGGAAGNPDDHNFLMALKAQEQSSWTFRALRIMKRNACRDQRDYDRDLSKSRDRILRQSKENEKKFRYDAEQSNSYFDKLSGGDE